MGLPIILSIFHLATLNKRRPQKDPEKGDTDQDGRGTPHSEDEGSHHDEDDDPDNLDDIADDGDLGEDPLTGQNRLHRLGSATSGTLFSTTIDDKDALDVFAVRGPWWKKCRAYVFPPEETDAALEKFAPNYRWTPIVSGVVVPFCILLEIPGLTEHWYIRTEANNIVESRTNPPILDIGLAFSMACALAANICLVMRFLEKRVKTVTLLTIVFLTLHDVINIVAVIIFGVEHRFNDGFTYGQSFWLTVCSTVASTITNVSVIIDYVRTPHFARSGSGLTRKQRALVIIVIVLLVYIALGALVNSFIMHLNFVDGLYFTVVTIETIGFGDIHPTDTGSRIFTCCYMAFGIINVGVAVAMTRETVLEGLELGYRKRLRMLRLRRHEARRFRRWEVRWRKAVEWRLKEADKPIWVPDNRYSEEKVRFVGLGGGKEGSGEVHYVRKWLESVGLRRGSDGTRVPHVRGHPPGKHLNIDALSAQQLEAAALEAGVPLEMFLTMPRQAAERLQEREQNSSRDSSSRERALLRWFRHRQPGTNGWPSEPQTPTHAQLGRMAAMITKFTIAVTGAHVHMLGHSPETHEHLERAADEDAEPQRNNVWFDEHNSKTADDDDQPRRNSEEDQRGRGSEDERPSECGEGDQEKKGKDEAKGSGGLVTGGSLLPKMPQAIQEAAKARKEEFGFVHERGLSDDAKSEEQRAYFSKLAFAWSIFLLFWFVGSAIFSTTEGWAYGDAMYFCFMAFTTTGYGDFAPASPAGRSVFVVWALLGVATMTILIAVIEEAGSSRYKNALHSKAFDNAVKKFRQRENHDTEAIAARSRPQIPKQHSDGSLANAAEAASETAQQELERLPDEILKQARIFHSHMQYFANNTDTNWEEAQNSTSGKKSRTPSELRALLNQVAQFEDIGERTKRDILEDEDTRHTLLMLSIETNLRRLINAAQSSLGAIAERDSLVALQRQRELESRPSSSKTIRSVSWQRHERSP
ncbi:hypothetical protein BC835DRAFT_1370125 [Cytidiella melzeri]|nr:hypothetical protein BC835DRAFT_1370125 [Cytidiella melzeri]